MPDTNNRNATASSSKKDNVVASLIKAQTTSDEKENQNLTIRFSTKLVYIKHLETAEGTLKKIASVVRETKVQKTAPESTAAAETRPTTAYLEEFPVPEDENENDFETQNWSELQFDDDYKIHDDLPDEPGQWWRYIISGGLAGSISRTCTAPLDRMKFYLQVQKKPMKYMDGLREMLEEGGIMSFWRGNAVNILKIAPESAIKFLSYEQMKRLLRAWSHDPEHISAFQRFIAGASAGVVSQSAIYPMEVLKTRLMLRKTGQFSGIINATITIYRQEGLLAFYRGFVPNVVGIIPYAGVELTTYELLKSKWLSKSKSSEKKTNLLMPLACGSISSCLGQTISYPFSLIRTRMQANRYGPNVTLLMVAKHIFKYEGARGFYRGILSAYIKLIPSVSISYTVYEWLNRALGIKMM